MQKIPTEFKEKYNKLLGEKEAAKFFKAIEAEDKTKGFRLNSLKNGFKDVAYPLDSRVPFTENGYYGTASGKDSEWLAGKVYSQDPSAMYPAEAAQIKPGEVVLDLCAAPGGKSTALVEKLQGKGTLVANEISTARAKILRENLERWGAVNSVITNENPARLVDNFKNFFDKIVVDAPCSGEGMFRKEPDAIKYWSQEYVLTCQSRQKEILNSAVEMLKPGGMLVYSTCTYAPEEDEEIVSWLVENYDFKILPLKHYPGMSAGQPEWGDEQENLKNTVRMWFQNGIGEGQFVSLLQKPGELPKEEKEKKKKRKKEKIKSSFEKIDKKEVELIKKVLDKFNLPTEMENWEKKTIKRNDHVVFPALNPVLLKGLHVLNNGVELGLLKKNRFEPSHALAEVLGQKPQTEEIKLNEEEFKKFVHGESIKLTDNQLRGFVLVSYQGNIFSFGKVGGDNILKNFYPKGLRK
ncbi:RNA methyltransferase [Lactobacillus sp. PV037]|uniref:RsmB/NOP family class I SAM-dependent RNA methyltransferase n=1 Tax=Lactobacillus sp. PV037 TaxID=2594496 RepID=UPI002240953E|nr:RsmB/NOP family class I SAM-dependent RNA methyltransferase [Lactobacillus sp. PV037]QNQ83576.1 RNA methyltransferase [Lactobacillus sp. PV037]